MNLAYQHTTKNHPYNYYFSMRCLRLGSWGAHQT